MAATTRHQANAIDHISFLFGQVISQVDYLFENGFLSQDNYATIAGALLQSTPSSQAPPLQSTAQPLPSDAGYFTDAPSSYGPAVVPSLSESSATQFPPPPTAVSSVSGQKKSGTPSLLKFRSKSSKGKDADEDRKLPQTPFAEADEPQLGKVNRRVRSALQGGFVLGQIVDQALTLTPGIPEGLRESIVEKVEEGSRDYVQKATDPRNQALWKENAQRAGSSVWRVARGGGGTSRASGTQPGRDHPHRSNKAVNAETGEFSLIASGPPSKDGKAACQTTSSVHSFFAGDTVNITTVTTIAFLSDEAANLSGDESTKGQLAVYEQAPHWPDSLGNASVISPTEAASLPPGGSVGHQTDPHQISGRDW